MSAPSMVDFCQYCEAKIYLIKTGEHSKWVTNPKRPTSWNCPADRERPVLAHAPAWATTTVINTTREVQ